MITCTCCKGDGIQKIMSRTYKNSDGREGWEPPTWHDVACVWCRGTGQMTPRQAQLHQDCLSEDIL